MLLTIMKKDIIKIISLLFIVSIFFGCSSFSQQGDEIDFTPASLDSDSNLLVLGETGISLPEGWRFAISDDREHFLEFSDPEGIYKGGLEFTAIGFSFPPQKFRKQFIKDFLEKKKIQAVYPVQEQETSLEILDYRESQEEPGALISFIPEPEGYTIAELYYPVDHRKEALSLFSGIILSIKEEEPFYCKRNINDVLKFFNTDGIWTWCGDTAGGSLFTGFFPDGEGMYRSMIAVWENSGEGTVPSCWDKDKAGDSFNFELCVNNRIITAEGSEYQDGTRTCSLYSINEDFGSYFIFISIAPNDATPLSKQVHLLQGIRDFFLDCITLL